MSEIWRAPTEEIDPLTHAISIGIRARLFEAKEVGCCTLTPEGWVDVTLGGVVARIDVSLAPLGQSLRDRRPVQFYRAGGHAAWEGQGHRFEADVAVDLVTRALVDCTIRTFFVGKLGDAR